MEYRSWISTLSGHLFFHLSEPWNYRLDRIVGDVIHFNEKIDDERYIGISLLADLRDKNTKNKVKYTRIFFFGKTHLYNNNDGKDLRGTISFFSNGKNDLFEKNEQEIIKDLLVLKDELENPNQNSNVLVEKFNKIEKKVLDYKQEQESMYTRKLKFHLQSEGLIELGNEDNAEFTHHATKAVYRQAYYFIKFMFHNHMHHVKSAEDILRLTKISNKITDQQFAFYMISDIKKYMVELKHSRKGFKDLEGFSAYAKSLLRILEKKGFINTIIVEREEKYFDNFVQSVNQYITVMKFNIVQTKLNSLLDTFLKIFVILMSFIAPYAIIKSKDILDTGLIPLDTWLESTVFPMYLYGFFILLLIIPMSDFIYNGKHSFMYEKMDVVKSLFGKWIKKRHNPTLTNSKLNKIIDLRHSMYHVEFKNKGWYFYSKVIFTFSIFLIFIKIRF